MGRESSLLFHYYARITTWKMGTWTLGLLVVLAISTMGEGAEVKKKSRTNSRFLRTFSSPDYLNNLDTGFGRREHVEPQTHHRLNGNSPVFYIRLPPSPYILVPGLGYVSPHPYNSPVPGGVRMPTGPSGNDLSAEPSAQKNVISLPLKFLSNGRPAQIESPKKPSKVTETKGTALISGGKYSFNGRPSAVFVVRSPA